MKKGLAFVLAVAVCAVSLSMLSTARVSADTTTNYCSYIYSPGYWKNWKNHYSAAEFQALINATPHFSGKSIAEVEAMLKNTRDQFHRHLASAELNVALNPDFAYGSYLPLNGFPVFAILGAAVDSGANPELDTAIRYLGSNGEGSSAASCLVQAEER